MKTSGRQILLIAAAVIASACPPAYAQQAPAATSIVTVPLQAANGTIPARLNTFRFVGAPASLSVAAGSRITVTATVPVAVLTGAPSIFVDYDVCIKTASTPVRNTGGSTYFQTATVTPAYAVMAISTTFLLRAAGRYAIGFCARNKNPTLVDHDVLRGFVQVSD